MGRTETRSNIAKHGVDLALAERFDWNEAMFEEDHSKEYGEQREIATGWIGVALYVYVYTLRDEEETMPSAYGKQPRRRQDATRAGSTPLTDAELAEVEMSRAEARRKALDYADLMSDEEDARLTAAAESDPDNPPLAEENWRRMRPAHEVHPHLVRKSLERKRGRPSSENPKQQVTLRLDQDILKYFRAGGPGWQTAINDALRRVMKGRA